MGACPISHVFFDKLRGGTRGVEDEVRWRSRPRAASEASRGVKLAKSATRARESQNLRFPGGARRAGESWATGDGDHGVVVSGSRGKRRNGGETEERDMRGQRGVEWMLGSLNSGTES
ncbi:uncharacterized protein A4U43_C03F31410 [Asparagus officinalis]|uniref:Uncharacterized protein n=1 Tax=Asparagus officinalis TaxID=4686 RepID=A0A5P1FIJ1_ASPOF|nr:uncharacterized protein A4U43_C03F31410 [Asparagus officinalis]